MSQNLSNNFSSLSLSKALVSNLDSLGYKEMTPVQATSLPAILDDKDLIVQAKTGSGKTAAFALGILQKINPRFFGIQALIICPTRELADQVAKEIRHLSRCIPNMKTVVLCGGKPLTPQSESLKYGAHIVVGTPGRLKDHLSRSTLDISGLETLVLDEADRMLDMGFYDEIINIINNTPKTRQTLLFSATFPDRIKKMTRTIQRDPKLIKVDATHDENVIEQLFYLTNNYQRKDGLLALFEHFQFEQNHKKNQINSVVIFCDTKIQCHEISSFLNDHHIENLALHGDLDQRDRDQVLVRFSNKSCAVLVATDVAARGLDIKSLQMVINYELPHDPEIFLHRIGRTGRAGETGLALSLYTEAEIARIIAIEDYLDKPCKNEDIESLKRNPNFKLTSSMSTIQLDSGKKNKMRPGDLLGALTKDAGLAGSQIGKINIFDTFSYIAIDDEVADKAVNYFRNGKVKGRKVKARLIG